MRAAHVVVAAGAWSGAIDGLPRIPLRPVKGQILRLRDPVRPRADCERIVRFEGGYLVPRGDGRYVLGATMEERGFDTTVTAGGLYELLRDAGELVPGVHELVIEEMSAGLRPATPDNAPVLGPAGGARRPALGDRPSPQRDPARAGHGRRRRRRARDGGTSARSHPRSPPPASGGCRRDLRQRRAGPRRAATRRRSATCSSSAAIDPDTAGIAVAVDAEVARRGVWPTRTLADGARVEIVRAVQGG